MNILNDIKNKNEIWISKNYPDFHLLVGSYIDLPISWREKLYLYLNGLKEVPICYCGSPVKFISLSKGYRQYCSTKCLSGDEKVKQKRKDTCFNEYGVSNPMGNKKIKNTYKDSIIKKYGVDNISKSDLIKKKKESVMMEKYGVNYNSQREEIRDKLSQKMKKKTHDLNKKIKDNLKLYLTEKVKEQNIDFLDIIDSSMYSMRCEKGHEFDIHKNMINDRMHNKNTICTVCNPISSESDLQNQLYDYIESIYDGEIIKNDRQLIGMELDVYIPDLNMAFEFNGIYWHSDKYKDKKYHFNKTNLCLSKNIHLIHIWEDEWKYKTSIVKSRILNLLGKSNKIYARNCKISEVDHNETKRFLIDNHIQGYVISKYNIGLFHKDELVSIMTFGSLRISLNQKKEEGSYELLRFCNKLNLSIVGGASKLLKYFIKKYEPKKIISYADRGWSNGKLYYRLGFEKSHITNPNYYYVVNGIRRNRFGYRKSNLVKEGFDPNKSESQIMMERGFYRIYDSGSIKFILDP